MTIINSILLFVKFTFRREKETLLNPIRRKEEVKLLRTRGFKIIMLLISILYNENKGFVEIDSSDVTILFFGVSSYQSSPFYRTWTRSFVSSGRNGRYMDCRFRMSRGRPVVTSRGLKIFEQSKTIWVIKYRRQF